jgi:cysteine desulfurase
MSPPEPIYLDNNAGAPLDPLVAESMSTYLGGFVGNPSSDHVFGRRARRAVSEARQQIADLLEANDAEIIFTSGATEANNLAIASAASAGAGRILASPVEHPSCLEPIHALARRGFHVDWLTVDGDGRVVDFESQIERNACLVAVQLANSETGTVQDVAQLARQCPPGCWFHCDAAQAVGKIRVSFVELGVTSMTISGHKLHGPSGIGALLIRRGATCRPLLLGGHQQGGVRAGTEPVAAIVGLARAVELACRNLDRSAGQIRWLRDRFESRLLSQVDRVICNGSMAHRLPNTSNVSFLGASAEAMLIALDLTGVCCSAGTACSSGSIEPSGVLAAMGVGGDRLTSALRFSLSRFNTQAEIDDAVERIVDAVVRVRRFAPRCA